MVASKGLWAAYMRGGLMFPHYSCIVTVISSLIDQLIGFCCTQFSINFGHTCFFFIFMTVQAMDPKPQTSKI